jgi:hypothetical protein
METGVSKFEWDECGTYVILSGSRDGWSAQYRSNSLIIVVFSLDELSLCMYYAAEWSLCIISLVQIPD